MHPFGIYLIAQERQRQFLREAEQDRIWKTARRAAEPSPSKPHRPRVSVVTFLRRFVQLAGTW